MTRRAAPSLWLVLAGTIVYVAPTLATRTATLDSLEPIPLLLAMALGMAAGRIAGGGRRVERRPRRVALGVTALAFVVTALPFARRIAANGLGHENLLAASIATVVLIGWWGARVGWERWSHLALGFGATLALGSRSATLGLLLAAGVESYLAATSGRGRYRLLPAALLVLTSLVAVIVVPGFREPSLQLVRVLLPAGRDVSAATNLLPASEGIDGAPWTRDGVDVAAADQALGGYRAFTVKDVRGSSTSRSQVRVALPAGETVRLSFAVRAAPTASPGVTGWAPAGSTNRESLVRVYLRDGAAFAEASGEVSADPSSVRDLGDGWREVSATLTNVSGSVLQLWLGPTPDVAPGSPGRSAEFALLMLKVGAAPTAYSPTYPEPDAVVTARSRLRTYELAWRGFVSAPSIGLGFGSYVSDQRAAARDGFAFSHAHNLVLHTAYERGSVGLVGLVAILAGLWLAGGTARWAAVVAGVMAMNLTDLTLWNAAVAVPLGLATGLAAGAGNREA